VKIVFAPEQQIFMIESYFCNGHTIHTCGESDSVQWKPGDLRFVLRKIPIDTVQRQVEDERQLSLRQLSQQTEVTMACMYYTYECIIPYVPKNFWSSRS
jgi:hypothetical protein